MMKKGDRNALRLLQDYHLRSIRFFEFLRKKNRGLRPSVSLTKHFDKSFITANQARQTFDN